MSFPPLPIWTWMSLLALLTAAVWHDLAHRRIPNRLLWMTATLALLLSLAPDGVGLLSALGAGATVMLAWSPLYLIKQLGGGDLKLMATAGLLVGMPRVTALCLSIAMAGGLLALGWFWRVHRRPPTRPTPFDRMPYALAIAMGTATHGLLGGSFGNWRS